MRYSVALCSETVLQIMDAALLLLEKITSSGYVKYEITSRMSSVGKVIRVHIFDCNTLVEVQHSLPCFVVIEIFWVSSEDL